MTTAAAEPHTGPAAGTRRYRLISVDGHLNEPGDLWTSRVPKRFVDAVPRIESFEKGDAWVLPGIASPVTFGWGACAGKKPEDLGNWCRFEDINPGSYDPKARVLEMDEDRVDAEVIYPSGQCARYVAAAQDPELHLAMVRAYNDFLAEFCAYAPDRLGGAFRLPNRGVAQAVAEVERVKDLPGCVAFHLMCYPHGDLDIAPEDDALWAAIQATGKPLTIHVSLSSAMTSGHHAVTVLPGTVHFYDAPGRMLQFIFSGVLDRFPDLRVVFTEVDCGWIPYFEEQADDNFLRHSKADLRDNTLTRLPSEYMHEFFPVAFINDSFAIKNIDRIGADRMLWSNDYPHITSDWPYSWKSIKLALDGVPFADQRAILAGNALRLFKFGA
ncbi:MAG TPA: amidohydrolase family protein [Candidatus Angelobacter sp.]|nr:amidohydrolase family protein [Candidatus Angelobacter sp.]